MVDEGCENSEEKIRIEQMPLVVKHLVDSMTGIDPNFSLKDWLIEKATEIVFKIACFSEFYTGSHYWWDSTSIRRSIFMGDYIYAISHAGITVTNLTTMETVDSLVLREAVDDYYYYGDGGAVSEEGTSSDPDEETKEDDS